MKTPIGTVVLVLSAIAVMLQNFIIRVADFELCDGMSNVLVC